MVITLGSRRPLLKSKPQKKKEARLNILINSELKEWAHMYADRNYTTLTAIIVAHLVDLQKREERIDVEQI